MSQLNDDLARTLFELISKNPADGFEALMDLVRENAHLRQRIAVAKIALNIMKTVMKDTGLAGHEKEAFENLSHALSELK